MITTALIIGFWMTALMPTTEVYVASDLDRWQVECAKRNGTLTLQSLLACIMLLHRSISSQVFA